tara:strand:- start:150 stop:572 length:423 start_codon:yes stop_codon:yes gene_type:complete
MNIAKTNALKGIVKDILGVDPSLRCRKTEFIQARAICYAILRQELGMTYQFIGKQFGMNHVTVMSALRNFKNEVEVDKNLNRNYSKAMQVWKMDCQEYIELNPVLLKNTVNNLVKQNKLLNLQVQELSNNIKAIQEKINV